MNFLLKILLDERGGTLAITRKTANTLATAAGMNTNYSEIEAVVNGDIDATNLEDAAVTAAKLASDAVTTVKILDANVTAAKLATDAVETAKIKDANVTAAKLASDAVETAKIKDANVTTDKIADANVTTVKIADSNVTIGKINFDHDDLGGLTDNDHPQYVRGQSTNYKIDSGTVSLPDGVKTAVSFNFTFASAPKVVISYAEKGPGIASVNYVVAEDITTTGFNGYAYGQAVICSWIAVGTAA